jgi:hypothetical protein
MFVKIIVVRHVLEICSFRFDKAIVIALYLGSNYTLHMQNNKKIGQRRKWQDCICIQNFMRLWCYEKFLPLTIFVEHLTFKSVNRMWLSNRPELDSHHKTWMESHHLLMLYTYKRLW